jgi:MFS transporter, ACS family, hexuronate transporter
MWKWWICLILFLATVLNYLDRQTMALCAPAICSDFKLNNEQWGELLSAFRWTYAVAQIPAGYVADRFSVRIVYALAVGVWSAAGAAAALALGPGALAWTRRALGLGEAFNWPCALRVTANLLPPKDRGLGNGIFASGAAAGAFLAPFVISPIAAMFGWRAAFLAIGCLGAFWIALWWLATRRSGSLDNVHENPSCTQAASPARPAVGRQLVAALAHPGFWLLMLVSGTVNPCSYFIAEWIPKYLHDQRGFGLVTAGLMSAPIFLGTDLGNIGGGGLVKYLVGQGWSLRRARGATVSLSAAFILPAVLVGYVNDAYAAVALLLVASTAIASIGSNYMAALQEISFANVGLIAGILGAFGNVVGAAFNPLIGRYVDATGHYHLVFVLLGTFPLVGLAALLLFDAVAARRSQSV